DVDFEIDIEIVEGAATQPREGRAEDAELGQLWLQTEPSATIYIDGKRIGQSPLRVQLSPGRHAVRMEFPDNQVREKTVTIQPGTRVNMVVTAD
ncbi:MAG: PEGA domain-containing protein, partial [Myxococcota bacterium]